MIAVILLTGAAEAEYDPEDPATWNWTIVGDSVTYSNASVLLDDNITVGAGGSLTLVNVTVTFNCTWPGEFGILVEAGGALQFLDLDDDPSTGDGTHIRSRNQVISYWWRCEQGSKLMMRSSIVENCGWLYGPFGPRIDTDDAIIMDSTFRYCRYGLYIVDASPTVTRTLITKSEFDGVYVVGGSPTFEGCEVTESLRCGFRIVGGDANTTISNCTVNGTGEEGIRAWGPTQINNCTILGTQGPGISIIFAESSWSSVVHSRIRDVSGNGIRISQSSNVTIEGNDIQRSSHHGIDIYRAGAIISHNDVVDCVNNSIHAQESAIIIEGNTFEGSGQNGLVIYDCQLFMVYNNTIRNNRFVGIFLVARDLPAVTGWVQGNQVIGNGRVGVYVASNVTVVMNGGSIADNGWYGIQCEEDATLEWDINTGTLVVNETLWIRGYVSIDTGGNLTLVNTTMAFAEHSIWGWGHVTISGGEMWVLDGSPDVIGDGSEVTVDLANKGELGDLMLWIRDGGRIEATRSSFLAAQVQVVDGTFNVLGCQFSKSNTSVFAGGGIGELPVVSLDDCTFTDGVQGVVADEAIVSVVGCSFLRMAEGINLSNCENAAIEATSMISTTTGVRLWRTFNTEIQNCSLKFCKDAISVELSQNLLIDGTIIDSSSGHGVRGIDSSIYVWRSTISRCRAGGIVFDDGVLMIANCTLSNNERAGIRANNTLLTMDGTSVTGTGGIGVWNSYNMSGIPPLDMYLMRDSFLQGSTAYDLRLEGRFIARVYNTRIEPEETRVYDEVQLEVYNPYSLEVRVTGVQPVPPPPVDYTLIDPFGKVTGVGTFPNGTNELAALWALAWTMNATDTTIHTPYTATVTVAGRDWTGDVELGFGKKSVIVVDLELLPKMSTPETVVEGEDVLLDGSASIGYPFGIAQWMWEMADGTVLEGPKVTVRFPSDGEQRVRLTVEDTAGNNKTVSFKLTIQDAVPEAQILPGTPDTVDEDQVLTLEGRYVAQVDDVIIQEWDFGDGNTATGPSATHAYKKAGSYNITFTVVEEDGSYAEDMLVVTVVNVAPTAAIKEVELEVGKGERFDLDGSLSNDTPSDRGSLRYMWDMGGDPFLTGAQAFWRFQEVGVYTINLMVVDDDGDWDRASMTVTVVNRPPTIGPIPDAILKATDPVWSHKLEVSDPDDDLQNLTLSFPQFEPGGAFSAWAERDDDGGWTVYVIPRKERDGSRADVEVTVRDPEGATASTTFTIDIDTSMVDQGGSLWWVVIVAALILLVLTLGFYAMTRRQVPPPPPA